MCVYFIAVPDFVSEEVSSDFNVTFSPDVHVYTAVAVLADTTCMSPRKLIIVITRKHFLLAKSVPKICDLIFKTKPLVYETIP